MHTGRFMLLYFIEIMNCYVRLLRAHNSPSSHSGLQFSRLHKDDSEQISLCQLRKRNNKTLALVPNHSDKRDNLVPMLDLERTFQYILETSHSGEKGVLHICVSASFGNMET